VPVQRKIRDQPLELRVFLAQLPDLSQFAQPQSRVLLLPFSRCSTTTKASLEEIAPALSSA
jgi:hypothetical protein